MDDRSIRIERAQNLWSSFERKLDPLARSAQLTADPKLDFDRIGGLVGPKDEILTYACAATNPAVYSNWGTFPPSGILLIGRLGTGKNLLAQALATQTETSFVRVDVPRLVLDVIHAGGKVGELTQAWTQILDEMPPLTVYFDELEFSQAQEIGSRRQDLPIGPVMDFLLEIVDRTIAQEHLVVGATSHPDTLRPAFVAPGRFERVVEVTPVLPGDVVEALRIHASDAEKRSGRPLFDEIAWAEVVGPTSEASTGDWVRILHAVLRRKARAEVAGDDVTPVTTADLKREVDRFMQTHHRFPASDGGNYV
jgi:ATP-dependent 26S proteasome regulatory subunit